jgi:hypothetical protein
VSVRDETSSPLFKILANQFHEMAVFFEALADPDRDGGSPGSPAERTAERPISITDIGDCIDEGNRAQKACREAGGSVETCYATGRLAEADCLRSKLKEPDRKPDK